MSGEIDAVGEIMTGAAVARAIEPDAGEGGKSADGTCLNCGAELIGHHCHQCGQVGRVHRTLAAFGHDFMHSILHFDGKIWRTLPLLFFKPGELTRRYIHGERARFVSPLALFLFTVFLMFAVFSTFGGPIGPKVNTIRNGVAMTRTEIAAELVKAKAEVRKLRTEQASAATPIPGIEGRISGAEAGVKGLETAYGLSDGVGPGDIQIEKGDIDTGSAALDAKIKHAVENPSLLLYKVQSNAYKFSWSLILLSTPLVWLLFAFDRRYGPYDHAVFVTYSITFASFLLVLMAILGAIGPLASIRNGFLFVIPIHMYAQLKGTYELSRRSALWRSVALIVIATLVLSLFAIMLLMLGIGG